MSLEIGSGGSVETLVGRPRVIETPKTSTPVLSHPFQVDLQDSNLSRLDPRRGVCGLPSLSTPQSSLPPRPLVYYRLTLLESLED